MSRTINLVDGLLSTARHLQQYCHSQSALEMLRRLADFRQLPAETAEEAHRRIAEIYAQREEFKKARRHMAVALTYVPQRADNHHRMACWIEADSDAAIERAGRHYRRAVRCDSENAEYWADYGDFLLDGGRTAAGRKALRRAARLAMSDPDVIGRVAESLRRSDLWDEARNLLRRAMFQSSQDRRFRALWQQHQFAQLHQEQQARAESAIPSVRTVPRLLPFLRNVPASPRQVVDGKVIRLDAAADTIPPPKDRHRAPRNRGAR